MNRDPKDMLKAWERTTLCSLQSANIQTSPCKNLTCLAYFFWNDARLETEFYRIQCAFLSTFVTCGKIPAVLVVNRTTEEIVRFCKTYEIDLQEGNNLTNGIESMCIDCLSKLHRRFKTDYVMIIQDDGFPLRTGTLDFVGKFDYIGAPWPGHCTYYDLFPYPRFGVGNGGFSIRSKRICEAAAQAYCKFWRHLPYSWLLNDDVFYCKTMPFLSRSWRKTFHYASRLEASRFSYETDVPHLKLDEAPIGFHSATGFQNYTRMFGTPQLMARHKTSNI